MIPSGRVFDLFALILVCVALSASVLAARRGKVPSLKKLAALDAIEECVGRGIEMNRPILYFTGTGGLSTAFAAQTVAGLSVLSHVSRLAAKYGAQLIVTNQVPEQLAQEEAIVEEAFKAEGKPVPTGVVRHLSDRNMAYAAMAAGIVQREKPSANIFIGLLGMESLIIWEAGYRVGAINIGGTASVTRQMDIAIGTDYMLIAEDIFAAGAYLSKEPDQLGTIAGQDLTKAFFLAISLVGALLSLMNIQFMINLLRI
ncbi:MAG: DUF6754 domain-containing protein [archaeon]